MARRRPSMFVVLSSDVRPALRSQFSDSSCLLKLYNMVIMEEPVVDSCSLKKMTLLRCLRRCVYGALPATILFAIAVECSETIAA